MKFTTPVCISMALVGMVAAVAVYSARQMARKRAEDQHRDECLDQTLEDSFPASDPPPF